MTAAERTEASSIEGSVEGSRPDRHEREHLRSRCLLRAGRIGVFGAAYIDLTRRKRG